MPRRGNVRSSDDRAALSRRRFVQSTGLLAGAGLLGTGASNPAAALLGNDPDPDGDPSIFTNVRVQEALQAWERGYRGNPMRSLALTDSGTDSRHGDLGPWNGLTVSTDDGFEIDVQGSEDPFAGVRRTGLPELVAWHNDHTRFGGYDRPRDENGHGTHCASIMTGSGRASAIDLDRYAEDAPRTTLVLGDTLTYEVEAEAGTGVFASAYGTAIDVVIEGPDGEELARSAGGNGLSETTFENTMAETGTVHDEGEATYTVRIQAIEGQILSTGEVETVAVGAWLAPDETAGGATGDGDLSVHAGVAPGFSLVSLTDLGTATESLGDHAQAFAETFNVRAVNMSWGYVGGLPLGAAAETLDDIPSAIRRIAEAGMLSVAAAGNDATPASGNGAPAVANEAISVVATDERDGISSFSSGGLAGIDESGEPYMKPDVTAPGGELTRLDIAADTGEPGEGVTTEEPESAAAEAELEPVVDLDELDAEDVEPSLDIDPAVTGELDYEVELADVVTDALDLSGDETLEIGTEHNRHRGARGRRRADDEFGELREYTGKAGTSMAAPSVAGMVGLVADALENDAPSAISIPEPAETGYEDVLRLKSVILATASESALVAAPYHAAKAPVYTHGRRDPYEGYGRANVGTALDAVTRDITGETVSGEIGLDVPRDERALAGYVRVDEPGELEAAVEFGHLSGGNSDAALADPHVDLFAYDVQNPDELTGDPNVVARDAGIEGDAAISWSVSVDDLEGEGGERVFLVVAKLVSVPGLVNGFDARARVDLSTTFDPEGLVVEGTREDDGSVYTGGQTTRTELDVEVRYPDGQEVVVRDTVPPDWEVDEEHGDVEATTPALGGGTHVYFGLDDPQSAYEGLTHFAQAPDEEEETGPYEFGPIAVSAETGEGTLTDREWTSISGTERFVIAAGRET
ncbi:S8 family serine peptidase [Natronorarus salvus]|uniref:S8 family serine peptidase n=1 Tax=Natronorarus salvus TaxID=3117733 RepID=UPI002F265B71